MNSHKRQKANDWTFKPSKKARTDSWPLFATGDEVLARWKKGDHFRGVIQGVNSDNTYVILFEDGDIEMSQPEKFITTWNQPPLDKATAFLGRIKASLSSNTFREFVELITDYETNPSTTFEVFLSRLSSIFRPNPLLLKELSLFIDDPDQREKLHTTISILRRGDPIDDLINKPKKSNPKSPSPSCPLAQVCSVIAPTPATPIEPPALPIIAHASPPPKTPKELAPRELTPKPNTNTTPNCSPETAQSKETVFVASGIPKASPPPQHRLSPIPALAAITTPLNDTGNHSSSSPPMTSQPPLSPKPKHKTYNCPFEGCLAVFFASSALNAHIRAHTGERPFRCPYEGCGKAFTEQTNLSHHMKIHKDEKPFKCPQEGCGAHFRLKGGLTRHMRIHTGERPFPCTVCKARFSQKEHLASHVRAKHFSADEPYRYPNGWNSSRDQKQSNSPKYGRAIKQQIDHINQTILPNPVLNFSSSLKSNQNLHLPHHLAALALPPIREIPSRHALGHELPQPFAQFT